MNPWSDAKSTLHMVTSHCEDLYKLWICPLSQILEIFQSGIHFNETNLHQGFSCPTQNVTSIGWCRNSQKYRLVVRLMLRLFNDQYCLAVFNPLYTGNPQMGTLVNSEDVDEMQHNAAFHQCLHCLLRLK